MSGDCGDVSGTADNFSLSLVCQCCRREARRFVDEEAHFGVAGLEIGFEAAVFEGLAGGGADGADEGGLEGFADLLGDAFLLGDAEEVDELHGGGEEDDVDLAGDEAGGGLAEGGGVFGEVPAVDADGGDGAALNAKAVDEVRIGFAVFLEGEAGFGAGSHGFEEFAPGVGLGDLDVGNEAEFADGGGGFGAADDEGEATEGVFQVGFGVAGEDGFPEEAEADAGEEDDGIEVAGEEAGGEEEGFVVLLEIDLAHGGGDEGFAGLFADEGGHFLGAAGFEREDAEAVEGHIPL